MIYRRLRLLAAVTVMTTQSQNKLVLFFLIEGNLRPSSISVPYYHSDGWPVTIDDLRRGIFECHCKDLARMYGNLTIIKVGILLVIVVTSLLLDLF
jgi:hypothetical protein